MLGLQEGIHVKLRMFRRVSESHSQGACAPRCAAHPPAPGLWLCLKEIYAGLNPIAIGREGICRAIAETGLILTGKAGR